MRLEVVFYSPSNSCANSDLIVMFFTGFVKKKEIIIICILCKVNKKIVLNYKFFIQNQLMNTLYYFKYNLRGK